MPFHEECIRKWHQFSGLSWSQVCPFNCAKTEYVPDMFSRALRQSRMASSGAANNGLGGQGGTTSAANTQSEEVAGEVAGEVASEVANDSGHTATAIAATAQGTDDDGNNGGINPEQRARLQLNHKQALERRRLRCGGQSDTNNAGIRAQTVLPDDVTEDTMLASQPVQDDGNEPANAAALIELADSEASSHIHANR